jgi:hypothetical protein
VIHDEVGRFLKRLGTSVDVQVIGSGSLVRVRDTGELWDVTSTGLLVKSLNVTTFTNLEGGRDVALEEFETGSLVDSLGEISILGVGGNESNENNDSSHVEELGDFGNSADVLSTVLSGESETLVETHADNITIEDEGLGVVLANGVNLLLKGFREGGFTGTRETSKPVSGTTVGFVSSILVESGLGALGNDSLLFHMVDYESGRLVKSLGTSVDVEVTVGWGLVGIRDTGKLWDVTSTGLLVKSLNVTTFANLKGGGDVALEEFKTSSLVEVLSEVSILGVGGNEGDENNDASHVEELGDFGNSTDVLGSILGRETKTLVETHADNVTVKDEDLGLVTGHGIKLLLEGFREG